MFLLIAKAIENDKIGVKISIHLMFLLIESDTTGRSFENCFNTSHVSINRVYFSIPIFSRHNFNTSHVSINPNHPEIVAIVAEFQYISCFY